MGFTDLAFQLSAGMARSVGIFALTLLFSLPLGLVVALGRMSRNPLLRTATKVYISIMRGTPLVLQL
ncbi:MAG: ABC transporter permease subunit, partial [Oscillospiraceae bacterium]